MDCLGTTLISEDWGDDPFDSNDGTPKKTMMLEEAGAKSFFTPRKWVLKTTMKRKQAGAMEFLAKKMALKTAMMI